MALSTGAPLAAAAHQALRGAVARSGARPLASVGFDRAMAAASGWFLGGLYLDGWAHNTIPSLETFFTPWHGVLYSGFLVTLAVLAWGIGRGRAPGRSGWSAIPAGYELSLVGGLLFLAGGVGDMLWHIALGVEDDLEALLSPTHLLLLLGGALLVSGPVRADARRRAAGLAPAHPSAHLPRLLALTYVLAALAFFTQYASVWGGPWLSSGYRPLTDEIATAGGRALEVVFVVQALNLTGVLVQSALLAGFVAAALRGGRVPAGGFTLMIGLYVVLTVLMRPKWVAGMDLPLIAAGLLAGGVADVLNARLRPTPSAPGAHRLFLALVPAAATAASLLAVGASQGSWWSVHLWTGAVALAGAAGWLVGLVASPAPVDEAADRG